MFRKLASILAAFLIAAIILVISVFRSASARYSFVQAPSIVEGVQEEIEINYQLPYQGKILPDHFLWPLKATRDKLWLFVTTSEAKKSELMLLFADKRLVSAKLLLAENKPELAVTTLSKAEKYLEQSVLQEVTAREKGLETKVLLQTLALASLKHQEVIAEMLEMCPEDARQVILETRDYPQKLYRQVADDLSQLGEEPPINPFED